MTDHDNEPMRIRLSRALRQEGYLVPVSVCDRALEVAAGLREAELFADPAPDQPAASWVRVLQGMLTGPRQAPAAELIARAYERGVAVGREERQREVEAAFEQIIPRPIDFHPE